MGLEVECVTVPAKHETEVDGVESGSSFRVRELPDRRVVRSLEGRRRYLDLLVVLVGRAETLRLRGPRINGARTRGGGPGDAEIGAVGRMADDDLRVAAEGDVPIRRVFDREAPGRFVGHPRRGNRR